jgi:deazaflavin-dependent oxidoreductase (nitroreductase family)
MTPRATRATMTGRARGGAFVPRTYRLTRPRRLLNSLVRPLIRLGLAGRHTYLLTVVGRTSGRRYSTPVKLVEQDGGRWLVAPYGERAWVKNARAAGWVELARAGRGERVGLVEAEPAEAAAVLRCYLRTTPVTAPFFAAGPDSPLAMFAAEAAEHPVFRLADVA